MLTTRLLSIILRSTVLLNEDDRHEIVNRPLGKRRRFFDGSQASPMARMRIRDCHGLLQKRCCDAL